MVIARDPITFVAPRADDATQSVLVKTTLSRMPPSIRVMQYVRARIVWSNEPQLTVPIVAVNRISGQYFVFVAEQGPQGTVARQKPITVGEVIGDAYIVAGGLKAGDRVIVSNIQKLGDGAPVKPAA
jgi:multidrug efflux pump subunit AcrA (membrane-fusion protein)